MNLFIEDFMEGIMADAELECHHSKFKDPDEMELLKEKLHQLFKYKLDGSKFYIGKDMTEVHKDLGITDEIFDKACDVFTNSVKKVKPNIKVMKEFIKRISDMRPEIVFPPKDHQERNNGQDKMTLFKAVGEETGLRNIIEIVFELAKDDQT